MRRRARLVAVAVALVLAASCRAAETDSTVLRRSWEAYRATFVTAEGRVVRPEHQGDTVSEGQAYTLLRSAWMDDQATFDRVWRWTREHLSRTSRDGSSLLAWHWVPDAGGRVDDWNVATDADADVALALLMADARWRAPTRADLPPYRDAALALLRDLIEHAVGADEAGRSLLLPGAWADQRASGRGLLLNPSYFAPASYRLFHEATADGRWLALAEGSYDVLDALCAGAERSGVVPDWVRWWSIDRWSPGDDTGARSSWDAVRVPWRVATDWIWFEEARARDYLGRCLEPFVRQHLSNGMAVAHALDGKVLEADDHPLANALFSFVLADRRERDRLIGRVQARIVRTDRGFFFGEPDRYYVNSLAYLPFLSRAGRYQPPGPAVR